MTGPEHLEIVNKLKEKIDALNEEIKELRKNGALNKFERGWKISEEERVRRGALM